MSDKRVKIFNAVMEIINNEGLNSGIKISDIAKKAEIGKGTIYEYFKSKDEVIAETLIYMIESSKQQMFIDDYNRDLILEERLMILIEKMMYLLTSNAALHDMFTLEKIGNILSREMKLKIHDKMCNRRDEFHSMFNELIKTGIKEGKIPENYDSFHVECALNTIFSTIMDYIQNKRNSIEENKTEFINKLAKLIIKMIA